LKITYFDNYAGELNLVYNNGEKQDGQLKTATFFVSKMKANSLANNFDFALEAGKNTQNIVVSIVRVIQAEK
jgi:hypothetical protein